jgi:hypothetical protein
MSFFQRNIVYINGGKLKSAIIWLKIKENGNLWCQYRLSRYRAIFRAFKLNFTILFSRRIKYLTVAMTQLSRQMFYVVRYVAT